MIDKLKRKIFWIIQISLTSIILGIIVLYSIVSYKDSINSATIMMDRITGEDDKKSEEAQDEQKGIAESYGIYQISINNSEVFRGKEELSDEVKKYAISVSKKSSEEGIIGEYVYKVRKIGDDKTDVTLMKNESIVWNIKFKIILLVVIGIISIIIVYIIAKKMSKTIVKPVAETFEKQKQFISDASHELKTPLAVIEANSEVLEDKVGENKWNTYIQNEVQSMNKLVNELLLLAKMEDTTFSDYKKFNLSKEIKMIISSFESMAYENQIKLITHIKENIEFNGDKEDIKHILSTLLDNAIKHTPKEKRVIVELFKEKNEIRLQVKNEGEPIPKEEQSKIFERFYRVDKSRNRDERRYGLGLAIAKQTAKKYNGTIEVNCKDGITCFTVKLAD